MASSAQDEPMVVLTQWGVKWLKFAWKVAVEGSSKAKFTKQILERFDEESGDPEEYVDEHTYTYTHKSFDTTLNKVTVKEQSRTKKVLIKGKRTRFAVGIARLAYNKFGERKMSEANVLVTRKWIQKLLETEAYKDLRTTDKNIVIDRSLFLSFVPTNEYRKMVLAIATPAWKDRVQAEGVFGRVFRLASALRPGKGEEYNELQ